MPVLPFSTVDVFTQERFGGNPLAVVLGGADVPDAVMQKVAAEFKDGVLRVTLPKLPEAKPQAIEVAVA